MCASSRTSSNAASIAGYTGRADRRGCLRRLRLTASAGAACGSSVTASGRRASAPGDFLGRVAACEQTLLGDALAANHFNQRRTAAALGFTYDQRRHHLKKHALSMQRRLDS